MNEADSVLREIEDHPERYPIVIGPERGKILDDVIGKYRPLSVLEVGTFVGYSAIRMGRLLSKGGRIVCVDKDPEIAEVAKANIAKAGLSNLISVRVGDAKLVIPTLQGPFDMVFLDALKSEYMAYLRLVEPMLHVGSVVVADNVKSAASDVADYLAYVRGSGRYSSKYHESKGDAHRPADAVEVSVRL
jgi:predicted O-methyltransferase YrrM